jgi:glycerol-3-phosphate cytidylyltransferase-like family protein
MNVSGSHLAWSPCPNQDFVAMGSKSKTKKGNLKEKLKAKISQIVETSRFCGSIDLYGYLVLKPDMLPPLVRWPTHI